MKASIGCFLLLFSNLCCRSAGRREWTDIETYHSSAPFDFSGVMFLFESDPLRFTNSPSAGPSGVPSISPSMMPSLTPSAPPTRTPSVSPKPSPSPSVSPSRAPTRSPSIEPTEEPTASPTSSPTMERFPPNDPPSDPGDTYFNYDDARDASWGPGDPELVRHNATYFKIVYKNNGWGSRNPPENWYWNEFDEYGFGPWSGMLAPKNPKRNRCEKIGKQSPIDIRDNGGECFEHHQIRTRVSHESKMKYFSYFSF